MMARGGGLWQLVSRFMPCSIASFGLGGSQAVTWIGLLLRRETDGRCIGVCEARKSGQITCWKLQFPRMKTQTEETVSSPVIVAMLLGRCDGNGATHAQARMRRC